MDNSMLSKYRRKAKDSFKTKKNLFVFDRAINDKTGFTIEDFGNFQITNELIEIYAGEYWQQEYSHNITDSKKVEDVQEAITKIESENKELLQQLEKKYIREFSKLFPESDFEKLLKEKECHYCGITIDKLERLANKKKLFNKTNRGWTLEIDRLMPNLEYSKDNCVMACYWCNNAKTDEFDGREFEAIGQAIGKIWEKRLNE